MSTNAIKPRNINGQQSEQTIYKPYIKSLLDLKVTLAITEIGKNIKQNLEKKIISKTAGKCIEEGYIKPNSIKIVSYSSGTISSDQIEFHVVFDCMICLPVEGMFIECTVKTITKAGIHAQVIDEDGNMPITMFIARDHHTANNLFNSVKENMKITARVIGIRYELNDLYICAIGKLTDVDKNISDKQAAKKPRIVVLNDEHLGGGGYNNDNNIQIHIDNNEDMGDDDDE